MNKAMQEQDAQTTDHRDEHVRSNRPSMRQPIVRAHDVYKTYRLGSVDVPVLKGASLTVHEGEWVAILGASGSGKSTLLHLLGDLDEPDAGHEGSGIFYEGQPIRSLNVFERNRYRNETVGFVFQFYHLLPELTVVENAMLPGAVRSSLRPWTFWAAVMAGCGVAGAVIGALLWMQLRPEQLSAWSIGVAIAIGAGVLAAIVGVGVWTEIASLIARYGPRHAQLRRRATEILESFGLRHRLRHRPRELSGGERQRVAIARALMNSPKVLLADEPTGNLDEATGSEILDLIAEQHRRGLTIIMVTHDESIAGRADRIVRLHNGRVVE